MSWYTKASSLVESNGAGDHWTQSYTPGANVPVSGIYKCIGCKKEVTSNKDDPFPPQNHHQHTPAQGAVKWKLNVRTNTTGE
jgi:hypothetical protein